MMTLVPGGLPKCSPINKVALIIRRLLDCVVTPWVFSNDLGFFDPILGSWVFEFRPTLTTDKGVVLRHL